ncbi:hypothetical protein AVEN_187065-1, partial [Araneus ventricosus]
FIPENWITPDLPEHLGPLNDSNCNSSDTEVGILVIITDHCSTSPVGTTRGLFRDGSRHFEPRFDDENDTRDVNPTPSKLPHYTSGRTFDPGGMYQHALGLLTRWICGGIGFRTWSPPTPRPYYQATVALK